MPSKKPTVNLLYVDSDPAFLELISEILPKYGTYTITTTQSPNSALKLIEDEQYDCVIFDYALLNPSQLELLTTITEHSTITPGDTSKTDYTGAENFPEVIQQIEILTGKQCVGLQLKSREQPYPLKTITSEKRATNLQPQDNNPPNPVRQQRPLIALHEATGELMEAQTKNEILEIALETANKILQLPALAIYWWDEQNGVLRPHTVTPQTERLFEETPTFSGPESLAWEAFLEGEFRVYNNLNKYENRYNPQTPIDSELFAPLGDHGLLIAGSTELDAFKSTEIKSIQMLVANTVKALDFASQSQALQQKEEQLHHQKEQLSTLKRINRVIRKIGQAAVTSSTRAEVEQTICENLTTIDPYSFAWIGRRNQDGSLSPQKWSGTKSGFLDQLREDTGNPNEQAPPAERALQTREPQVIQNIFHDSSFAPWRKTALDNGFQSAISLPLSHHGTTYGVLEIYASEPSAFPGEEQEVLSELSEMIVHSFTALERKQTLMADSQTKLNLRMQGEDDFFSRVAQQTNTVLELDTVVSREDGTWLVYITGNGSNPSAIPTVISEFTAVESAQHIQTNAGSELFGVVLSEFELADFLTSRGAKLNSISATCDETTLSISVSKGTDVRSLVATCRNRYPSLEMVRRNADSDEVSTSKKTNPQDQLTDRQYEVLQVAVNQGYFKWPRDSTGEEIADQLGISPPTFHRHIRRALQEIVGSTLKA